MDSTITRVCGTRRRTVRIAAAAAVLRVIPTYYLAELLSQSLGGQAVLVLNQELRFPIWKQLAGGVFWDAGNVWALARDFSPGDLRQDVGAGLRLMLPFGPVRVEYAFVLNRRPGESSGRVVFGLGHAF